MTTSTTHLGVDSFNKLKKYLQHLSEEPILIVTGKTAYKKSGANNKLEKLTKELQTEIKFFSDFGANPKANNVKAGVKLFRQLKPGLVIAIGGGSTIDTAKLITLFGAQDTSRSIERHIREQSHLRPRKAKLIAIPTTCGTGSEATHFAVVYLHGNKYSVAHKSLIPDVAIIDPRLMMSLSSYQTASTALDALAQAIESYWCVNSNSDSRKYASKAIKLINNNIITAVDDPTLVNKTALAKAANWSGRAINITKTTAPHALSYYLTSKYNVPHGHAVSLTLAEFLIFNYHITDKDCRDPRGTNFVKQQLENIASILTGRPDVKKAKTRLEKIMEQLKLKRFLIDFGVKKSAINNIVASVNLQRLKNNPRNTSSAQLKRILLNTYQP